MHLKNISFKTAKNDIIAGIIVALVSIPISMGYAQIAGLPAAYGLYGSLIPVLVYALTTSSPQFVFGVDATPAVLVGGTLATLGITTGSDEAMRLVPVITLVVAAWLLIFSLIKAGRIVNYISTPVMGGFISGIGITIILMQVPKLFGGAAGTGELIALLLHMADQLQYFNVLSAVLGFGTVIIILVCKKYMPKFPMSVMLMALGAMATAFLHIDRYGVRLLPHVDAGFPKIVIPDITLLRNNTSDIIVLGLTCALVIMAQTLLATNNYANRYGYKVDNNREVIAYSLANVASAVSGSCPLNGSVSRTGIADQFGCKSQLMTVEDFNKLYGDNYVIDDKASAILVTKEKLDRKDSITINNSDNVSEYKLIDVLTDDEKYFSGAVTSVVKAYMLIVKDMDEMNHIRNLVYGNSDKRFESISYNIYVNTNLSEQDSRQLSKDIEAESSPEAYVMCDNRYDIAEELTQMYGGLLFLGCYIGILFLMATVLIIYYKQISEGYEDRRRFEIMMKVGMSREEVKRTIKSQILMIVSFRIIKMIMVILSLGSNMVLFVWCTLFTVIVFCIIYALVYALTAKEYYNIVQG